MAADVFCKSGGNERGRAFGHAGGVDALMPDDGFSSVEPRADNWGAGEIDVRDIDAALRACVNGGDDADGLYRMIRYHLGFATTGQEPEAGSVRRGKRMRALLSTVIGRSLGVDYSILRPLVVASEMMHSASLVHDDIQDEDTMRWNRETVWKRFGIPHAINVGDAMIGLTYQLLASLVKCGVSDEHVLELVCVFNAAHLRMTEGQYLDIAMQTRTDVTLDRYYRMIGQKTGAACSCACRGAAILGMASAEAVEGYTRYGESLGVFYQICDDIASVWGPQERTGKTPLQDALLNKSSLPVLLAIARQDRQSLSLIARLSDCRDGVPLREQERIRSSLEDSGVHAECMVHARRLHADVMDALNGTGAHGAGKDVLTQIVRRCHAGVGESLFDGQGA